MEEFSVRLCLLVTSEAAPIRSYQHGCPIISWTKMTPIDMPNWTEKSPWGLNPTQRTTGNWGELQEERQSSPGESMPTGCPVPNGSRGDLHISNIIYTELLRDNHLYPVNRSLIKHWLASSQAGSRGGAMRILGEESSVCSHDPASEDARCDCLAEKGTKSRG